MLSGIILLFCKGNAGFLEADLPISKKTSFDDSIQKSALLPGAFNGFVFNLSETPHVQNFCQCEKRIIALPSVQRRIMEPRMGSSSMAITKQNFRLMAVLLAAEFSSLPAPFSVSAASLFSAGYQSLSLPAGK